MKPDILYQKLKELADKLAIEISEQNFRSTGGKARSGLCKIRGQHVFFIDKHLPLKKKAAALAGCLADMPIEQVFMVPALREYIGACSRAGKLFQESS